MKTLKIIILLIAAALIVAGCNKDDEKDIVPDTGINAFYIDGIEYPISKGTIHYFTENGPDFGYVYIISLFSDNLYFDGENATGTGYFINMPIYSQHADILQGDVFRSNNKLTDTDAYECVAVLDYDAATEAFSGVYHTDKGSLTVQRNGDEFELILTQASANRIRGLEDFDILSSNHTMMFYFKGSLVEFELEFEAECELDMESVDFSFGIDYEHPEKYLEPGEQSDLKAIYVDEVRAAIGTYLNDINGVLKVCHWVNQNFTFENAGGSMVGKENVNELYEGKTLYGCHTSALMISSLLRKLRFPALLVETADVDWAYRYINGETKAFAGHVMSEVFVGGKWILLDNNCSYVDDYDYLNPYISTQDPNESGLFVFTKGVDSWAYGLNDISFSHAHLISFVEHISCYEELFYTVNYNWKSE
ncbi:hypothetical protein [Carboxylicivirga sp. N1Y90]|uniref:hypothetical protein n=1 Tax=Carboxylicivirga fragile TaxID=3417571 RepID=UPI003D354049|nr:transglutaminase domain-containing protein [Marinilabiliaceae bacterium N1Y90]